MLTIALCICASSASAQVVQEPIAQFIGPDEKLEFTMGDLQAALLGADSDTRQIAIAMSDDAAKAFALFTTAHIGQSVSFVVCAQTVLTATVRSPITSGRVLTGHIALEPASAMADAINGLGTCPN